MVGKENGGLWSAMTFAGRIRADAWDRAVATGEVIGTCRACGEYIVPDDPPGGEETGLRWFTTRCLGCGRESAAPDGRIVRQQGRRGHG